MHFPLSLATFFVAVYAANDDPNGMPTPTRANRADAVKEVREKWPAPFTEVARAFHVTKEEDAAFQYESEKERCIKRLQKLYSSEMLVASACGTNHGGTLLRDHSQYYEDNFKLLMKLEAFKARNAQSGPQRLPVKLLQIGVFRGESLAAFAEYFRDGRLYGLDLNLAPVRRNLPFLLEIGAFNGGSRAPFLTEHNAADLSDPVPDVFDSNRFPFDIIVDDACRVVHCHMQVMTKFYRVLRPGGLYFIEASHGDPKRLLESFPWAHVDKYDDGFIALQKPVGAKQAVHLAPPRPRIPPEELMDIKRYPMEKYQQSASSDETAETPSKSESPSTKVKADDEPEGIDIPAVSKKIAREQSLNAQKAIEAEAAKVPVDPNYSTKRFMVMNRLKSIDNEAAEMRRRPQQTEAEKKAAYEKAVELAREAVQLKRERMKANNETQFMNTGKARKVVWEVQKPTATAQANATTKASSLAAAPAAPSQSAPAAPSQSATSAEPSQSATSAAPATGSVAPAAVSAAAPVASAVTSTGVPSAAFAAPVAPAPAPQVYVTANGTTTEGVQLRPFRGR